MAFMAVKTAWQWTSASVGGGASVGGVFSLCNDATYYASSRPDGQAD